MLRQIVILLVLLVAIALANDIGPAIDGLCPLGIRRKRTACVKKFRPAILPTHSATPTTATEAQPTGEKKFKPNPSEKLPIVARRLSLCMRL
ncbi:unnamed protein product [Caenorhabditis auriculariae]|uniref:Uncharacterized protein n=1 Tax=Caenorhabditis auriculariae TaxID=2777116 RepID=A0A8S1HGP5_9PELO|nr:unnamed protein product [Caenorhabditis auriculariae]